MTLMQSVLKKGAHIAHSDQKLFNDYERGDITLQECKKLFFENNKVDRESQMLITDSVFKEWLNGIGYRRYEE